MSIPLLFLVSIIPDIDLLIPRLEHRGPTHSIILATLIFIPIFTYYRRNAIPYFIALAQHALIGDYLAGGGIQLLWPLNAIFYYGLTIEITGLLNILLEWICFLLCFAILFKTRDAWTLLQPHPSNLILSIPLLTVFLPTFLSLPLHVPLLLVIPHLAYLLLFTLSILTDFKAILKKTKNGTEDARVISH